MKIILIYVIIDPRAEQSVIGNAVEQIQVLPKVQGNDIAQILGDMEKIVISRGTFAEDRKAADEGRYEDAINCFKAVSQKDTQFYEFAKNCTLIRNFGCFKFNSREKFIIVFSD